MEIGNTNKFSFSITVGSRTKSFCNGLNGSTRSSNCEHQSDSETKLQTRQNDNWIHVSIDIEGCDKNGKECEYMVSENYIFSKGGYSRTVNVEFVLRMCNHTKHRIRRELNGRKRSLQYL